MISASGTGQIPRPAPPWEGAQDAAAPGSERHPPLCMHCGAIGTHYLTCASLRLPEGYRPGDDTAGPGRDGAIRLRSGPDHPDWPLPPRN